MEDGVMAKPSSRLERTVRDDFGDAAQRVLGELANLPETLPLAEKQDPERLQAAVVIPASGDYPEFEARVQLARTDWRDALVAAELANEDWPNRLDTELGT